MRTELDTSTFRSANQCSRPPQGGGRGCHHEGPGEWRQSCSQAAAVLGGSVWDGTYGMTTTMSKETMPRSVLYPISGVCLLSWPFFCFCCCTCLCAASVVCVALDVSHLSRTAVWREFICLRFDNTFLDLYKAQNQSTAQLARAARQLCCELGSSRAGPRAMFTTRLRF
jgi:hypothetical protein